MPKSTKAAALLGLSIAGCSQHHSLTLPDLIEPPIVRATLPPHVYGAFAASSSAMDITSGNTILIIPTYADDANQVAIALEAHGQVAIVSAHHVFGSPKSGWEEGWAHTKQWMAPFANRVAAIYVIDEPLGNGIGAATRDEAIARVRADGYSTIVAEWIDKAERNSRAPSDYYGVTCYDYPGVGGWAQYRCLERYADHPEWNIVIGQAFDLNPRNGSPRTQIRAWTDAARNRAGVLFWVWKWNGSIGIADDPELFAAFQEGA